MSGDHWTFNRSTPRELRCAVDEGAEGVTSSRNVKIPWVGLGTLRPREGWGRGKTGKEQWWPEVFQCVRPSNDRGRRTKKRCRVWEDLERNLVYTSLTRWWRCESLALLLRLRLFVSPLPLWWPDRRYYRFSPLRSYSSPVVCTYTVLKVLSQVQSVLITVDKWFKRIRRWSKGFLRSIQSVIS